MLGAMARPRPEHIAWSKAAHGRWPLGLADTAWQETTTFVHFPGPDGGDAFAAYAAERFRLLVAPGRFFGEPRGARVALGGEPGAFAAALDTF